VIPDDDDEGYDDQDFDGSEKQE